MEGERSDDILTYGESDDDVLVEETVDVVGNAATAEERPCAPFVRPLPVAPPRASPPPRAAFYRLCLPEREAPRHLQ
jgi:hypothetical protein